MSNYSTYTEDNQDYQNSTDFNQSSFNPNFQPNYQNMQNLNSTDSNQIISNNQINPDPNLTSSSQTKSKNQSKTTSLLDIIKKKPMLYRKVKTAYFKQIETDIENGKKGLLDMDKFIYSLIEEGLRKDL